MSSIALALVLAAQYAATPADNTIAVTWWGCMSVEVNIGDVNIVFDPFVKPDEPRFDYIFCSHDHYDHCHEATLRKLTAPTGGRFAMLFAARGCFYASRIPGPNAWDLVLPTDLSFVPRDKCMAFYPKYRSGPHGQLNADQPFTGPTEIVCGRLKIEGFRSHEDPAPADMYKTNIDLGGTWPNLGYLVTDTVTGRSFAHTGDIWNAYPQMQQMRGKVDVLFYPIGKLNIDEKKKMMDYIRPKIAIPIHYRLFEPDFPIPPTYLQQMKEEEVYKDKEHERQACLNNWYCSVADPVKDIAENREKFKDLTRVVELKAGVRYVLPEKVEELKGRER